LPSWAIDVSLAPAAIVRVLPAAAFVPSIRTEPVPSTSWGFVTDGNLHETEPLFVRGDGLRRLSGMPPRPERFERAGIDVHAVLREA